MSRRSLFETLYTQHHGAVYAYFTACFDRESAEDLTQQTFLQLWRFLLNPGIQTPENWRAWIFRVAVNQKNDYLRLKYRRPISTWIEAIAPSQAPESMGASPDEATELHLAMDTALTALEEGTRDLILLQAAGLNSMELGTLFDLSPSTIRGRLSAARQKLRVLLEENGVKLDDT